MSLTVAELLGALRASASTCDKCKSLILEVSFATGDLKVLARKAARDRHDHDWSKQFDAARTSLATTRENAATHLDEPHTAPAPKADRTFKPKPAPPVNHKCSDCGASHPGNPERCPRRAAVELARRELDAGRL